MLGHEPLFFLTRGMCNTGRSTFTVTAAYLTCSQLSLHTVVFCQCCHFVTVSWIYVAFFSVYLDLSLIIILYLVCSATFCVFYYTLSICNTILTSFHCPHFMQSKTLQEKLTFLMRALHRLATAVSVYNNGVSMQVLRCTLLIHMQCTSHI